MPGLASYPSTLVQPYQRVVKRTQISVIILATPSWEKNHMSTKAIEVLLNLAPQVTLALLFMIGLYLAARFVTKQYKEQRDDIANLVRDTISARIAERMGKIQEESEKATKAREAIENKSKEVTEKIIKLQLEYEEKLDNLDKQIEEKHRLSESKFMELRALFAQVEDSKPLIRAVGEITDQQIAFLERSQEWVEVAELVAKIMANPDSSSKTLEVAGDKARKTSHFKLAEELYLRAWNKDNENLSARIEYLCLIAENDYSRREDCLKEAKEIVTINRVLPRVLARLSNALFELDRHEQVQTVCEAVVARGAKVSADLISQARRDLAVALKAQGKVAEAEEQLMIALKEEPDGENIVNALLDFLVKASDYEKAMKVAERLLLIDPLDYRYYLRIAELFEYKQDYASAAEWIERAKSVAPDDLKERIEYMKEKDVLRKELSQIISIGNDTSRPEIERKLDSNLLDSIGMISIAHTPSSLQPTV
jgi:tetratricopeptide (TPR) repeat protein